MKNLKLLCGAALLVAASGVQAEIVSMNDSELTKVSGQLGYIDTTHIVVGLIGDAHAKAHAVDDAIQAHVEAHVDVAKAHVGAHVDVAKVVAAAAVDAAQVKVSAIKVHVGEHVAVAHDIKQEVKLHVSNVVGALAAHHAGHHN